MPDEQLLAVWGRSASVSKARQRVLGQDSVGGLG